jgi:hypothetical protein
MKKFLLVLILLGVVTTGIYYYNPGLLGLDAPAGKTLKKNAQAGQEALTTDSSGISDDEDRIVDPQPSPLGFMENMDARAKAKAEGLPSLILWYGSDWMPGAASLVNEWNKLEKKNLPVVMGQIDERVGSVPELNAREKLLPTGAFMDLPVAVLMAPDETLLGIYSGKTVRNAAAMELALKRTLAHMPEYMKLHIPNNRIPARHNMSAILV